MYCNKCGNKVNDNQKYCNKCGNFLSYNIKEKNTNLNNENEIKNKGYESEKQINNNYKNENYSNNAYTNKNNGYENNSFINNNYTNHTNQNYINQSYTNRNYVNNSYSNNNSSNSKHKLFLNRRIFIIAIVVIIFLIIIKIFGNILSLDKKQEYYFPAEGSIDNQQSIDKPIENKKGKYKTAIITDNVYSGVSVNSIQDAKKLIIEDSVNQKQSDYPKEIIEVENSIIDKYGITAVNLKEMDKEYVEELEKVVSKIYTEYPNARGYLTNLTLTNINMTQANTIALFMPSFIFGTSNTSTTRPWVIKSQIQLNAKYFLNPERIDSSVEASSKIGHFPPNATRYSPLAHEFGHYLSFIALLNNYYTNSLLIVEDSKIQNYYDIIHDYSKASFSKKMLDEAYQNYLRDNSYIDFDAWRGKISNYALAKDETGDYIYDETIAEAFHDTYLNGNKANTVSKYIVDVLKKYIDK